MKFSPAASSPIYRPILMSAPMVRATLDDRKTQTRRIVKCKFPPNLTEHFPYPRMRGQYLEFHEQPDREFPMWMYTIKCPYGKVGDRLWVRESWQGTWAESRHGNFHLVYAADGTEREIEAPEGYVLPKVGQNPHNLITSIYMPRWASRLTLEITDIRVQRLQEISDADAFAEGIQQAVNEGQRDDGSARGAFKALWASINGAESWGANPFVWAVSFEGVENAR